MQNGSFSTLSRNMTPRTHLYAGADMDIYKASGRDFTGRKLMYVQIRTLTNSTPHGTPHSFSPPNKFRERVTDIRFKSEKLFFKTWEDILRAQNIPLRTWMRGLVNAIQCVTRHEITKLTAGRDEMASKLSLADELLKVVNPFRPLSLPLLFPPLRPPPESFRLSFN
eukprot:212631-Amorphochlora_amoeboformis.AAC.1